MSFFSDLFEGNFGNLGTDISHSVSSLGKHPSELYGTLGGIGAAGLTALTLGADLPFLGAAGAGGLDFGGLFGGAGAADAGLMSFAGGDAGLGGGGLAAIDNAVIDPIASGTSVGADLGAGIGSTAGSIGTTPAGFAATDAELGGGITGLGGSAGGAASPGLLSSTGTWAANNPLAAGSIALGGANLVKNAISPPQTPYVSQLTGAANAAGTQGVALQGEAQKFLQPSLTGKLPPQLEAQVQQALQDATNTEKARYASMGLSNSTMSADQQAYLQLQAETMRGQLAQQLAQTGTSLLSQATADLSLESQIYGQLMQVQMQQDASLEQSVSNFATSLAYASVVGQRKAA